MFVWVLRAHRGTTWNVAQYGMALSLFFLVIGAVLGIALGLQLAEVEIVPTGERRTSRWRPSGRHGGRLCHSGRHCPDRVVVTRGDTPSLSASKAGVVQMSLIFLAGVLAMLGVLLDNEAMLQANVPLEVIGLIILIWRLRSYLGPSQWRGPVPGIMTRTAVLGLVLGIALFAYVVSLFVSGAEFEEIAPWLVVCRPHQFHHGDDQSDLRHDGHGLGGGRSGQSCHLLGGQHRGARLRSRPGHRECDVEADIHPDPRVSPFSSGSTPTSPPRRHSPWSLRRLASRRTSVSPFRASADFTGNWKHFGFEVADGVATVTFDRPDKLNALTFEVYADLRDLLGEIEHRDDVRGLGPHRRPGGVSAPVGTSTRSSLRCWRWTPGAFSSSPG